jgi:hypothetical protein
LKNTVKLRFLGLFELSRRAAAVRIPSDKKEIDKHRCLLFNRIVAAAGDGHTGSMFFQADDCTR